MPYRYLEDVAIADVAFEADGRTLRELFQEAAAAMTNTMISDLETIDQKTVKCFNIEAPNIEMLLYRFLQELIFYKDAERLLFRRYEINIDQGILTGRIHVCAFGEEIDPVKHVLLADVKAVSFHNLSIQRGAGFWKTAVILDV